MEKLWGTILVSRWASFNQNLWKTAVWKAAHSCSPKLRSCSGKVIKAAKLLPKEVLPKALAQSISAKRLPQTGSVSNLFPKAAPHQSESCSQSCSSKLYSKASRQSCRSLKLLFKLAVLSCSSKLLLLPKAAPQSCSPKLPPKAAPPANYCPHCLASVILYLYSFQDTPRETSCLLHPPATTSIVLAPFAYARYFGELLCDAIFDPKFAEQI